MTRKRPTWYVDWRKLWHRECRLLGMMICFGAFDGQHVRMSKELYQQIRRVNRIYARLRIESEVMDQTWCRSMLQMIFRKESESDG